MTSSSYIFPCKTKIYSTSNVNRYPLNGKDNNIVYVFGAIFCIIPQVNDNNKTNECEIWDEKKMLKPNSSIMLTLIPNEWIIDQWFDFVSHNNFINWRIRHYPAKRMIFQARQRRQYKQISQKKKTTDKNTFGWKYLQSNLERFSLKKLSFHYEN